MPPRLGQGLGLRAIHYDAWSEAPPEVAWAECITENYLDVGGRPRAVLESVRREMPVVLHGVSLSIGSIDPLNEAYLRSVRALADEIDAAWVSDHLCWASVDGHFLHDLLPLPYSEEALAHVCTRVDEVQARLGRPLVLENPSTYLRFAESTLEEWEFLAEITRRTGARVLLDVNNVYVGARNFGFDANAYLDGIPVDAVWQFHLAGHTDLGTHVVDTHDALVSDDVWALYRRAMSRFGAVATCIEWDDKIPTFDVLLAESRRAATIEASVLADSSPT